MADGMTRPRDCETIRGQNIRELKEQVVKHLGVLRRDAPREENEGGRGEVNEMAGEPGEESL